MSLAAFNEFPSHQWAAALLNHLWQSTIVALIAWVLAQTLRKNAASTRYWLWMMTSVKLLIPFSALIAAGESIRSALQAPIQPPGVAAAMDQFTEPFPASQSLTVAMQGNVPHHAIPVVPFLVVIWASGFLAVVISWGRNWWRIHRAVRQASPVSLPLALPAVSSRWLLGPGVFGLVRPVLLLPEGILDRLEKAQLDAILAHETCHVGRHDNLTFAVHMVVEALFWFHPLVWWIRIHLVEERELACDEAVLQSGHEAKVYAEGILNVCKFYVESPLACVSSVGGSDLKKRIVHIMMTEQVEQRLGPCRTFLLGAAGVAAVALPIALGVAHAVGLPAQTDADDTQASLPKFEVATIKPNKAADGRRFVRFNPDGVSMAGVSPEFLLRLAFGVEEDRVLNLPGWAKSDSFDIDAKVDTADAPKLENLTLSKRKMMMMPLLEKRFNLRYHHETRELPVFALTIAKGGSKLQESAAVTLPAKSGSLPPVLSGSPPPMMMVGNGTIASKGTTIQSLIGPLSQQVGRTIIDKTGLTGKYDYTLKWTPDMGGPMMRGPDGGPPTGDSVPDSNGPPLLTALQEQLGLKLESQKGPVDVIVIDHIEPPSPN